MRAVPPFLRIAAAAAALGLWLALFFLGRTAGGAIHLLPLAAVLLVALGDRRGRTGGRPDFPQDKEPST
jgi:hypothetical protein